MEALIRLLTPKMAAARTHSGPKPGSVAELVAMTGRAKPKLTRTLAKLEAAGFIRMKTIGRRKAPSTAIKKILSR